MMDSTDASTGLLMLIEAMFMSLISKFGYWF